MRRRNWLLISLTGVALMVSGCSRGAKAAETPQRQLLKLDSTVLNLADSDNSTYVRIGVTLALAPDPVLTPVTTNLVTSVADDTLVAVASSRTSTVLLTPDGKSDLKKALISQLEQRLPGYRVEDIYFDEFLIQR